MPLTTYSVKTSVHLSKNKSSNIVPHCQLTEYSVIIISSDKRLGKERYVERHLTLT